MGINKFSKIYSTNKFIEVPTINSQSNHYLISRLMNTQSKFTHEDYISKDGKKIIQVSI